jgi:hypothetical protein
MSEVVGLFIYEGFENNGGESILINGMLNQLYNEFGVIKEILFFIDEDCNNELDAALQAGFEIKDRYRCCRYNL